MLPQRADSGRRGRSFGAPLGAGHAEGISFVNGRPVISWAHGTHGIADQCAPSRRADMVSLLPSIGKVVSQGYVVVATDYEGLGTPGTHPYLVGVSEARGALDIVKAAQQIRETDANDKTFVWGQWQGGQAGLLAGEMKPT